MSNTGIHIHRYFECDKARPPVFRGSGLWRAGNPDFLCKCL